MNSVPPRTPSKENPRKRPRRESGSPSPNPKLKKAAWRHDEQFWMSDGNIILVAQGVGFRVYRGWLSMQSEVFRDMFNTPQPVESDLKQEDVSDDCPVPVYVTDTALEMRSLLSVLLGGRQYMFRHEFPFTDLANCIRMAHKYDIQDLLQDCLKELERYFPTNLNAWNSRLQCDPRSSAIEAVNLARLTGTSSILPAALYSCCQLDGQELLQGRARADGIVETLSAEDLARCIDGKVKLCARFTQLVYGIFDVGEDESCKRGAGYCMHSLVSFRAHLLEKGGLQYKPTGTLLSWKSYVVQQNRAYKGTARGSACTTCINSLCKRERELRRELWDELPELMGLPIRDDAEDGEEAEIDDVNAG